MSAIGKVIDTTPRPVRESENIVIIGDDRQIPMANIIDDANFANERTFAQEFIGNNESISALVAGMYRTDDPYGTTAGIRVRDHELFVPERAVGRLVETPSEIIRSLEQLHHVRGTSRPGHRRGDTSLQTGYEFIRRRRIERRRTSRVVSTTVERLFEATGMPLWKDNDLATAWGGSRSTSSGSMPTSTRTMRSRRSTTTTRSVPTVGLFDTTTSRSRRTQPSCTAWVVMRGYSRSDIQVSSLHPTGRSVW